MKSKKKVKKKLNKKKLLVFILIFYLIGCICYNSFTKPIKNIIILGNNLVEDKEIIRISKIQDYPALLNLNKKNITKKLLRHPLIKDVKINKTIKYELIIEIIEKKVICEYENNYILSDNTKIEGKFIGTPTLINYVPEKTLKKFLSNMNELNYDIINSISEIEYTPEKDLEGNIIDEEIFKFKMNDGNKVIITINKINLMTKYQQIYASLGDKKGTLHLDKGNYLEVNK